MAHSPDSEDVIDKNEFDAVQSKLQKVQEEGTGHEASA
jgi:hypothetical protein